MQDGSLITPVVIDPNMKIPGSLTWNLGVQRQIGAHLTGEVNYVGSHSTHVLREVDGAPAQPALVQQLLATLDELRICCSGMRCTQARACPSRR